jgi:NADPH-dependent glutamate synthase beta subunit-like oxidoreductase
LLDPATSGTPRERTTNDRTSRHSKRSLTIELIEKSIVEHAWQADWIQPEPPASRTGKRAWQPHSSSIARAIT